MKSLADGGKFWKKDAVCDLLPYYLTTVGYQESPTFATVVMSVKHPIGVFHTPVAAKNPTEPFGGRLGQVVHRHAP